MEDIKDIVNDLGIEMSDEVYAQFDKRFRKSYKSDGELKKRMANANEEKQLLINQLEEANSQIEKFKGLDIDEIKQEAENWKSKFEQSKMDYEERIKHIEYESLIKDKFSKLSFSSESAKENIFEKVKNCGLKVEEGQIIGFEDYINKIKEKDPNAFKEETAPKSFTRPISNSGSINYGDPNKMDYETYKKWRKSR